MVRHRLYAPWVLSLAALAFTAGAVFAGSVGPYTKSDKGYLWDSVQWRNTADSTKATVKLKQCRNIYADGTSDWMDVKVWRNAGLFPPEDQGQKRFYCYDGGSYEMKTWGSGAPNMTGPENFWWEIRDYKGGTGGGNVMDFIYEASWDG